MYVKPTNSELKVVYQVGKAFKVLPVDGKEVSDTDFFWHRRLRDGDVVKANPPVKEGE
jgi:hypothetical protein